MQKAEVAAIESFIEAVDNGVYDMDYSELINPGQPLAEALAICPKSIGDEIEIAKVNREDYFNDFNFLKYLKSLEWDSEVWQIKTNVTRVNKIAYQS